MYKDTLKGMLELLQQDADIKRQKELADNPEKAQAQKDQMGKIEKSGIKKPSENRPGDWKCTKTDCGNINFAWRKACNNCDTEKPDNVPDYKPDAGEHENDDWFVGAIKTEKSESKTSQKDDRKKRVSSPRALDEQYNSDEESPRHKSFSRKSDGDRRGRDRDRNYDDSARSRDKERSSNRRERRRSTSRTRR